MLEITLLGTGGTLPLKDRWLSSCLLNSEGHSVLIDCGEGTQIALKKTSNKFKPIDSILFTHFHADHISGLPGFLLSMGNEGRSEPVNIVGIKGLKHIVKSLCVIAPILPFELNFIELTNTKPFKLGNFVISPFRVEHGVDCTGYNIELLRSGRFDIEKAKANNVPIKLWSLLQKGKTLEYNGITYMPDMVLGEKRKGIKITYCTDLRPSSIVEEYAENADLFICEGMFAESQKQKRAEESYHTMFSEAAQMAKNACVKRLWLTHFSPSLDEPEKYIDVATDIFPHTECGFDGKTTTIRFDDNV